MSATTEAVAALLAKYNDALNASSTDAVMPLYAEDGVFMPPYSQSAVGSAAVRNAYDAVFKAIMLNVKFTIAEIVELAPDWAFARTNSAGATTDHASGIKSAEGTRNCSFSRKIVTVPGGSQDTASRRRTRRAASRISLLLGVGMRKRASADVEPK